MRVESVSIAVALLAGAASAKEVFVGELPVSPFVGTEISTNVPFNVSRSDYELLSFFRDPYSLNDAATVGAEVSNDRCEDVHLAVEL